MKKYRLKEDLNAAVVEPTELPAVQQAKQKGLMPVGFGRYQDSNTNQVTHIIQNDQLMPYDKAVQTNTYREQSSNDINDFAQQLAEDEEQLHQSLIDDYSRINLKDHHLDAIREYTDSAFQDINDKLNSLPAGIKADKILPESADDQMPDMIKALDDALSKSKTSSTFICYTPVDSQVDITKMQAGAKFMFKGYKSLTISMASALQYSQSYAEGDKTTIMMQIMIPVGSSGMYVDDYSSKPGEGEFILPRGSKVEVLSGPNKIVGEAEGIRHTILYYNCQLLNK